MVINFIKLRKLFYFFSFILILSSIFCLKFYGISLGIELSGGANWIFETEKKDVKDQIKEVFLKENLKDFKIKESENEVFVFLKEILPEQKEKISKELLARGFKEKSFERVSAQIGKELLKKAKQLIIFSLILMLFYIALAFYKLPKPIEGWKIGSLVCALLFHDILILFLFLSLFSKYLDFQLSIPEIIAILTLIGYGINNFIIVYDRLREKILKAAKIFDENIFNLVINETLERQINTTFSTAIPLFFILFFSKELKWFSLTLILGLLVGLYSSICLAIPLTLTFFAKKIK